MEVFEDLEVLGLGSQQPEESLTFHFEHKDVEKPLDLSPMDSLKPKLIEAQFTEAISPKMAVPKFFGAPGSAPLLAAPYAGFSCPRPATLLPQSPLFGCVACPKKFGPSKNDQGLETGRGTDTSLVWGFPPRLPPVESSPNLAFSAASLSSRQFELPKIDDALDSYRCADISRELDSPPQKNFLLSAMPPLPPSLSLPAGVSFHPLPHSSPLHFPNFPAPLSTSHNQPVELMDIDMEASIASSDSSSDSPQHVDLVPLGCSDTEDYERLSYSSKYAFLDCETENENSFEIKSDKTLGFLESRLFKGLAKSDRTRRDFPASFRALEDHDDTVCKQSWRNSVPWSDIFSLQTEVLVLFLLRLWLICFII